MTSRPSKFLIAVPHYDGDRALAIRMLELMAEIETRGRKDVRLFIVNRGKGIQHHELSLRFHAVFKDVWYEQFVGPEEGHPSACNAMARMIFERLATYHKRGEWSDVECMLFMEPDCVPCKKDWIQQLLDSWEARVLNGKLVMGCLRRDAVDTPHINGNAVYSPEVGCKFDWEPTKSAAIGWDSAMAAQFKDHWSCTGLIVNLWKEANIPDSRMEENPFSRPQMPPCLIHGVKDDSAYNFARRKMAL